MSSVFKSVDSAVHMVRMPDTPAHIFQIKTDNSLFVAPVTGFALEMQGNYQFLHTVNEFIYLYTFGDRICDLILTGVCFTEICPGANGNVTDVFQFYKDKRIAVYNKPVEVQLGTLGTFTSFLVGAKLEQPKADNGIVQWVMRFNSLMPK